MRYPTRGYQTRSRASNQTRYYWNKSGLVQELVKGERVMDEVFTCRLANDLMEAFHRLMNREF